MKSVVVIWIDSASALATTWNDKKASLNPVIVTSIGYVQHETKKKLVLVSGYHSGGQVAHIHVIPKVAILKYRKLKRVN